MSFKHHKVRSFTQTTLSWNLQMFLKAISFLKFNHSYQWIYMRITFKFQFNAQDHIFAYSSINRNSDHSSGKAVIISIIHGTLSPLWAILSPLQLKPAGIHLLSYSSSDSPRCLIRWTGNCSNSKQTFFSTITHYKSVIISIPYLQVLANYVHPTTTYLWIYPSQLFSTKTTFFFAVDVNDLLQCTINCNCSFTALFISTLLLLLEWSPAAANYWITLWSSLEFLPNFLTIKAEEILSYQTIDHHSIRVHNFINRHCNVKLSRYARTYGKSRL